MATGLQDRFVDAKSEDHEQRLLKIQAELASVQGELRRLTERFEELNTFGDDVAKANRQRDATSARLLDLSAQLIDFASRETEFTRALRDSNKQAAVLAEHLAAANLAVREIEKSRSWRITHPLRVAWQKTRRAVRGISLPARWIVRRLRRGAKKGLLLGLAYLRSHPTVKLRFARLARAFRPLDTRLRAFAHRQSIHSVPQPVTGQRPLRAARVESSPDMRDLARRVEYATELEMRLDSSESHYRKEIERLTKVIEHLRAENAAISEADFRSRRGENAGSRISATDSD